MVASGHSPRRSALAANPAPRRCHVSASQAQAVPTFSDVAPVQLPQPIRLRILFAVMVGIFLAALDQFVVGTALPVIVSDLKGNNVYTWVFTAYLLTATISGPIYGKL